VVELVSTEVPVNRVQVLLLILHFICIVPITLGIAYLFYHQWQVLIRNTTSIEQSVRKWQEFDARQAKQTYRWKYDRGVIGNIVWVMGSSWVLWFLPTSPESDGYYQEPIWNQESNRVENSV
jgi:hypothetical protein